MRAAFILLAIAALTAAASSTDATESISGTVVHVADGDTLTVLVSNREVKVRLWGIDAPEKRQAFGAQAKLALLTLTGGKQVVVEVLGTDRYQRTLGWLLVAGAAVNRQLVQQGMAWWYRQYAPAARDLEAAELEARAAKRGLWADPAAEPPWLFRMEQRR